MSLAVWFGVIAGLGAAGQVAAVVVKRLRRVKELQEQRQRQFREAAKTLREKAKTSLALKREERGMRKELQDLGRFIDKGEEAFSKEKQRESHLYVFDERRNPGDGPFVARVGHLDFNRVARHAPAEVLSQWAAGRSYLVWGMSDKNALAKVHSRFPADKGFVVVGIEPYKGDPEEL